MVQDSRQQAKDRATRQSRRHERARPTCSFVQAKFPAVLERSLRHQTGSQQQAAAILVHSAITVHTEHMEYAQILRATPKYYVSFGKMQ